MWDPWTQQWWPESLWQQGGERRAQTRSSSAAPAGAAHQFTNKCAGCAESKSIGTVDWLDRRWYCKACGEVVLDNYSDPELKRRLRFLRRLAVDTPHEQATHNSFLGFSDPTCYCGKLNVPFENSEEYCETVAYFFLHGRPLFHMEVVGTGPRAYCEDLDVMCSEHTPQNSRVVKEDFLSLRMALMSEVFPGVDPLRVHIYDSSGSSQKHGHYKTSIHFVWEDIVVDEHRAAIVRQHCVEVLDYLSKQDMPASGSSQRNVSAPQTSVQVAKEVYAYHQGLGQENEWAQVFDTCVTVGGNGLRVPLADKREKARTNEQKFRPEHRPKIPVGTWVFDRQRRRAVCSTRRDELDNVQWVRRGLCRRPSTMELTPWKEPILRNVLETKTERWRVTRSGADDAVRSRRNSGHRGARYRSGSVVNRLPRELEEAQPWAAPAEPPVQGEKIALWFDGSHGDQGVGGGATVSLVGPDNTTSRKVFSGYMFCGGKFGGQSGDYLGYLLGLRQIALHSDIIRGRVLQIYSDSLTLEQEQGNRQLPNDAPHLTPLIQEAWRLLDRLHIVPLFKRVGSHQMFVEDRLAKSALRHEASSVDDGDLRRVMGRASSIWTARNESFPSLERCRWILDLGPSDESQAVARPAVEHQGHAAAGGGPCQMENWSMWFNAGRQVAPRPPMETHGAARLAIEAQGGAMQPMEPQGAARQPAEAQVAAGQPLDAQGVARMAMNQGVPRVMVDAPGASRPSYQAPPPPPPPMPLGGGRLEPIGEAADHDRPAPRHPRTENQLGRPPGNFQFPVRHMEPSDAGHQAFGGEIARYIAAGAPAALPCVSSASAHPQLAGDIPSGLLALSNAGPLSHMSVNNIQIILRKEGRSKSLIVSADTTAAQIVRKYGGRGAWELKITERNATVFPEMRLGDLDCAEPLDLTLEPDDF